MTPVEALKIALAKEDASVRLYKKLAEEHPAIRDLLTELLIEEEKHRKMIEKKLVQLTTG
ncbi:MAG: ferritin family protein [Candidatus Omnitrophica bacterium]|nr:ferritin family protein [Candidatus Omnitrophota bacterium]MDD5488737.1 ferritin family protein [Candidatus Omnitrophota bacterium]